SQLEMAPIASRHSCTTHDLGSVPSPGPPVDPYRSGIVQSWSRGRQRARIHRFDMAATSARSSSLSSGRGAAHPARSRESELAAAVKGLMAAGQRDRARERFGELVACQQRRAVRIALHYLRDAHDADEAVQDAFLRVFSHIDSYREELPFEVWFTRILVNRCLDVRKARSRRLNWALPLTATPDGPLPHHASPQDGREA